jgi:hypothetical protein
LWLQAAALVAQKNRAGPMPCSNNLKSNLSPDTLYNFEAAALKVRVDFSSLDLGTAGQCPLGKQPVADLAAFVIIAA